MNAVTTTDNPVSAQTLEHVLGTGDLSKLTTQQRVEYYAKACQSLGLNPLTRPFRFLSLNGQVQLYATRDCTDQLRKVHGITLQIVEKKIDGDLFIVTVRAKTKEGREDEDIGAVTLGQMKGDARANQLMKGLTKAKRRVTLSICGLGLLDESEVETLPNAQTYDAEAEAPPVKVAPSLRDEMNAAVPLEDTPRKPTINEWLQSFELAAKDCVSLTEVNRLVSSPDVQRAMAAFKNGAKAKLDDIIAAAIGKHAPLTPWDDVAENAWPGPAPVDAEHEREDA